LRIYRQIMDSIDVVRNLGGVPVRSTVYRNHNSGVAGGSDHILLRADGDKVALSRDRTALPTLPMVGRGEQAIDRGCIPNVAAGKGDVVDARGEFSALHLGRGNYLGCGL